MHLLVCKLYLCHQPSNKLDALKARREAPAAERAARTQKAQNKSFGVTLQRCGRQAFLHHHDAIQHMVAYQEVSERLTSIWMHAGMPARSLILGNVSLKPNRAAIEVAFGSYGLLEAVRTFPGKPYAIVHFHQAQHAAQAAASLDGIPVASISGKLQTMPRDIGV